MEDEGLIVTQESGEDDLLKNEFAHSYTPSLFWPYNKIAPVVMSFT